PRESLRRFLTRDASLGSLAAFRVAFGLVLAFGAVRFVLRGWVRSLYLEPSYHFSYGPLSFVRPPGDALTYALFARLVVSALCVAAGLFFRVAAAAFFLLFTYAELMERATYLNHYYLVSLLALLLAVSPAGRAFSLDVRRRPALRAGTAPAWMLAAFRVQVGV